MRVFVFGSNLAGVHGAGAARFAICERGAISGLGVGPQGGSYALPTKDCEIETLPLRTVALYIEQFKEHAAKTLGTEYQITRIGCGFAGFTDEQIAPLFVGSPLNCLFDEAWKPWFGDGHRYWGRFS